MNEIWKDILWYEGLYQVSNLSRVKSLRKWIVLSQWMTSKWYYTVSLAKEHKQKTFPIHRLVSLCFLENPHNYKCVNHKNWIKSDNHVENLEWCTHSQNTKHAFKTWLRINASWADCKLSIPVRQFSTDGTLINTWCSATEVKRQTGILNQHIAACCRWKRRKAGGFIWEYCQ